MGKLIAALGFSSIIPVLVSVALILGLGFTSCSTIKSLGQAQAARDGYLKDRDSLAQWGDVTCAPTLNPFREKDRKNWGAKCQAAVIELAGFKAATIKASNDLRTAAETAQRAADEADTKVLRVATERRRRAEQRLEKANAEIKEDRVGPQWFDAISDFAGLRPSHADLNDPERPLGGGGVNEGQPPA